MRGDSPKPIILISAGKTDSKSVAAIMASMRSLGAEPMLIANHLERLQGMDVEAIRLQARADIAKADAVILMGNNSDIDPADYHAARHPKTISEADTPEGWVRAAYEYILTGAALEQKKPFLGICGGMQRLAVLTGGTLAQHVPDLLEKRADGREDNRHSQPVDLIAPYIPVEYISIAEGSTLAAISQGARGLFVPATPPGLPKHPVFMDNSMHHQSVASLKNDSGLRFCASSLEPDQPEKYLVCEAIEADPNGRYGNQFVMGVQWHPEFGASDVSANLLRHFVDTSRQQAQSAQRSNDSIPMAETLASIEADKRKALSDTYTLPPDSWAARILKQKERAAVRSAA